MATKSWCLQTKWSRLIGDIVAVFGEIVVMGDDGVGEH
jgi:hypothetical protein